MPTLVDPIAASRCTGVPVRTIQRWVRYGRIIDYGDGQKILVDPGEIQQLADLRDTLRGQLPKWRNVA
jgi:hypothetical protein